MSSSKKPTLANYREFRHYPKIVAAVSRILERKRFVAPVELFVEMNLLAPADLARWKAGQVSSLERVVRSNLSSIGRILRLLRFHAHDLKLKPSLTVYQHRGHRLRFSKSGEPMVEEAWSRHFVVAGNCQPPAPPPLPSADAGPNGSS